MPSWPVGLSAKSVGTIPGNISDLSGSASAHSVSFTYTSSSGALFYQKRYSLDGVNWSRAMLVGVNGFNGLRHSTAHYFQVRGTNFAGDGNWSNTYTATTLTPTPNPSGNSSTPTASSDAYINSLITSGGKWGFSGTPKVATFSFPTAAAQYFGISHGAYDFTITGFAEMGTAEKNAIREIYNQLSQRIGVDFVEITEGAPDLALLRHAYTTASYVGGSARTVTPGTKVLASGAFQGGSGGDSWYAPGSAFAFETPTKGSLGYKGFLHEIGHGLGMKHPHEGSGSGIGRVMPNTNDASSLDFDSMQYTLMSYNSYKGAGYSFYSAETYGYPTTHMHLDVATLQYLYGENTDFCGEGTVHSWSSTTGEYFIDSIGQGAPGANRVFMCPWDGGGTDSYDFTLSSYGTGTITANLNPSEATVTSTAQQSSIGGGQFASCIYNPSSTTSAIESASVP